MQGCRPPRCRRRARPDATIRLHPLSLSVGVTTAHAAHAAAARCHRHRPFHCRPLSTPSTVTIAQSHEVDSPRYTRPSGVDSPRYTEPSGVNNLVIAYYRGDSHPFNKTTLVPHFGGPLGRVISL
ncbi:hypothetical protein ACLOJK_023206 [Asimina triloba]